MNVGILGYGEIGHALHSVYSNANVFNVKIKDLQRDDCLIGIEVLNIAVPYNDTFDFVQTVVDQTVMSGAKLVIIHSTIPVGTTQKIKNLLPNIAISHSPCRGVHPNLFEGIMTFEKFVGAQCREGAELTYEHLKSLGIKVHICKNSQTTELAKLLDTSYYGICIAFHGEASRACVKFNADFEDVMTRFNNTYNEGYAKLKKNNVIRPVLSAPQEGIGGHCVIQNAELLKRQFDSSALDLITSYKKKQ